MPTTSCLKKVIRGRDATSRNARAGGHASTVDTILDPAKQKKQYFVIRFAGVSMLVEMRLEMLLEIDTSETYVTTRLAV